MKTVYLEALNVKPAPIATDPTVKYDYDIVYVRAPRNGDKERSYWAEVMNPFAMDAGADLMLLHPDGSEEVLVKGSDGSVADPYVSFDGEWVYYAKFHNLAPTSRKHFHGDGADIYKIHAKSRKVVQLTQQGFTPNTGVANWSTDYQTRGSGSSFLQYGVWNLGPCPLPGGKVMFTSNRNAFRFGQNFGRTWQPTMQLFVMDEDGCNVECIGHLNLAGALHPTILKDGRVMFNSFEIQGLRGGGVTLWGLWSIHPDGTNWGPLMSAYESVPGNSATFHFQTQLSDGSIVLEHYYVSNNNGFGTYVKFPAQAPDGYPQFGPADSGDPRNPFVRMGRANEGSPMGVTFPFSPYGLQSLTPYATSHDSAANPSVLDKADSPRVGKVTHPSGAPDNHLLTVWSPGPVNMSPGGMPPQLDGGIYLIKSGKPIDEPGQMLLIKNDPRYNEEWPRALVPYKRIHGVEEPARLVHKNDGKKSPHLPEGTPFGLVGASSLYKRESFPSGKVRPGSVAAGPPTKDDRLRGGPDLFNSYQLRTNNWGQGADAGRYSNDDIWGIRILGQEPTTDHWGNDYYPGYKNHGMERFRILGEFPVRKFKGKMEPVDPDGNPDTSFLVKVPADVSWTFQTLDKNGMVLNMAQTWHQVRPGEVRNNCGGCHAHSQQPTLFEKTTAAESSYVPWDLTRDKIPLFTPKRGDESGKKWDPADKTGVRFVKGIKNVEFYRDVKPILDRSCVACHTGKSAQPAGNLVLDDDKPADPKMQPSGTYFRLALDASGRFGHKPLVGAWWSNNASRYVRKFQSRRSLLVWKVYARRLDGFDNDDFPTETVPGDPSTLQVKGKPAPNTPENRNLADLDYTGSTMPPPDAVAGTYLGEGGIKVKVAPLTDEDRLTLARWIDLGCPIDLTYDPAKPMNRGEGWMVDDQRPTLTLTYPSSDGNESLTRVLVGMHDYYTGLDMASFQVTADFPVDGMEPGQNLAPKFKALPDYRWELTLTTPISSLPKGKLTVAIKDNQGNWSRIGRTFSVAARKR